MHGHLAAKLDPLGTPPIGDPALDPGPLGLTPEVMAAIPSQGAAHRRARADARRVAAPPPGHLLRHDGLRDRAHRDPRGAGLAAGEDRVRRLPPAARRPRSSGSCSAGSPRSRRWSSSSTRPTWARSASRSRAWTCWCRCSTSRIERAAEAGARDVVIGMAHRGRLNVLAHTVGRPYETIFAEFEGGRQVEGGQLTPEGGTGDVKYHHGAEGAYVTAKGKAITVTLSPNPSHLEFVSPVVDGRARAKQTQRRGPRRAPRSQRGAPGRDPRRRGVRRPGRRGRDAQPRRAQGLPHRRHAAHHHQQPGRLHHRHGGRALHPLRVRPGQGLRHPDHPRQRRRRRGLPRRGAAGDGVPRPVPPGRADRPGRLPAPRPQRGRRAGLHPAGDVRADQATCRRCASCYAGALVEAGVITPGGGRPARPSRPTSGWWTSSRRSRPAWARRTVTKERDGAAQRARVRRSRPRSRPSSSPRSTSSC